MRSLAQPKVLGRALLAGLLTSAACYPRLAIWEQRGAPAGFLWIVLLWAMFVLWAFVFAWHFQYAHRPVFDLRPFNTKLWVIASVIVLLAALLLHFGVDPKLRVLTPELYPTDWNSWVRMTAFTIAFESLFLCFAPFAFFIRLVRGQDAALAMTVIFGLFVMGLRISATPTHPGAALIVELLCLRVLAAFGGLYLYLKGGALLVWWAMFVLQLRYILDFAGT